MDEDRQSRELSRCFGGFWWARSRPSQEHVHHQRSSLAPSFLQRRRRSHLREDRTRSLPHGVYGSDSETQDCDNASISAARCPSSVEGTGKVGGADAKDATESDDETDPCAICLEPVAAGWECQEILRKCGHRFHPKCAKAWMKRSKTCPTCRRHVGAAADSIEELPVEMLALLGAM
eukprot:TRINITY_DN26659_c0_g1_i1.p1 TRINITY_DN26659_c0_g1~~TRINITY_DN26659_c0_g1_i1.p1  ORF type:complete len:189 (+),score=28.84 TRINITY_DN26659_c0_g1_i1:37-567(+)